MDTEAYGRPLAFMALATSILVFDHCIHAVRFGSVDTISLYLSILAFILPRILFLLLPSLIQCRPGSISHLPPSSSMSFVSRSYRSQSFPLPPLAASLTTARRHSPIVRLPHIPATLMLPLHGSLRSRFKGFDIHQASPAPRS